MPNYSKRVKKIKQAAVREFGKEAEVVSIKGQEFADPKRHEIDDDEQYWYFRQTGSLKGDCQSINDPLSWRLDVVCGKVQCHALFNLRTDYTKKAIRRKFRALNVSREEFLKSTMATLLRVLCY